MLAGLARGSGCMRLEMRVLALAPYASLEELEGRDSLFSKEYAEL